MFDSEDTSAGSLNIRLSSPLEYKLDKCQTNWETINAVIPTTEPKEWKVSKDPDTGEITLNIFKQELFQVIPDSSSCSNSYKPQDWWPKKVTSIKFENSDTATINYRSREGERNSCVYYQYHLSA